MKRTLIYPEVISSYLKRIFSSQLRLNMLSGSISMLLGLIVSAIKYPLYLHFLGYDHYGAWLLLSTVLTFAQMGLLGISSAIVKLVAGEYEKNNHRAIQEYFITSLGMVIVVGGVLLSVSILAKWQIVSLLGLKGENVVLVGGLLNYMVIFSIGVLAYQVLNSVLSGVGRIDIANYSQVALQILPLFISIPLLLLGKGVYSLLVANVVAYVGVFLVNFIRLNRLVNINLLDITSLSWGRFKQMIVFGSNVFAGSMLNMMVVPVTKIFITRTVGIEGVPVFELAYRVGMQVRSVFEVAFKALMPEISKLTSGGSRESVAKINKIISKAYRLLFLGAIPLYLMVFMLAGLIFKIWLGAKYDPSIPIVFRVMLLETFISLLGVIPYYLCLGHGRVRKILIHHIVCASSTLILLSILGSFMPSINIVAIAWCFVPSAALGTAYLVIFQGDT